MNRDVTLVMDLAPSLTAAPQQRELCSGGKAFKCSSLHSYAQALRKHQYQESVFSCTWWGIFLLFVYFISPLFSTMHTECLYNRKGKKK